VLIALALAIGSVAVVLVASPWADRQRVADLPEQWSDAVCKWFARAAVALAAGTCVARFWWRTHPGQHALPGDQMMQVGSVVAEFAALAVLAAVVALQAPWKAGKEVMGYGMTAPLLAAVGCVIATIFGSSLTLAVANVIGSPRVTVADGKVRGETLLLPSTVYAGGLGMVLALLMVISVGIYLYAWSRWETTRLARSDEERDPDSVQSSYPVPGEPGALRSVPQRGRGRS
jgi:hypothetical protein